ncbi:MAG: Gfo/Idh/MocA family oxidoreductase [Candidatus Eisenbacteria bacterium]|nr:Gfo/Idh/MocA family oxidoreductase [Candidatus Eisenbacteria bacterium]
MSIPVRLAIFGNGFARTTALPCLRHVPEIEVVGIASPNRARVEETARQFGIPQASDDYRQILRDAAPNLAFVATPPHRHLEQSIDALKAGCHVICEKPTAMSGGESRAMLEAAVAHPDRLTLIDHELRFDPRRRHLRNLIAAGELGEIWRAEYTLSSPYRRDPENPWGWWSDRHQGGGAWGAIGSHAVDTLRWLLGEVDAARGALHVLHRERRDPESGEMRLVTADDLATASLKMRSGALAEVSISLIEVERRHEIVINGSRAAARWREQGPLELWRSRERGWETIEVPDELPPSGGLGIPDTDWARCFLRLMRAVARTLTAGEAQLPEAASFRDGHRNQLVLDAVYRSSEEARWRGIELEFEG